MLQIRGAKIHVIQEGVPVLRDDLDAGSIGILCDQSEGTP